MRREIIVTATGLTMGLTMSKSIIHVPFVSNLIETEDVRAALGNDPSDVLQYIGINEDNSEVKDGKNVSNDFEEGPHYLLSYAAFFHIFARSATLTAHTNGNLAVGNLDGRVNFGTGIHEGTMEKDISYIQNLSNIACSSFVVANDYRYNKIIFGKDLELDFSNNEIRVDGITLDNLSWDELHQDKGDNKYIDFDEMFAFLDKQSSQLASRESHASIDNTHFIDENNRFIDLLSYEPNEDNEIIIKLSAEVLQKDRPLEIIGLDKDKNGTTIIINVDTGGVDTYNMRSQIKIQYNDGTTRGNKETEHFDDNHLLWNFYDESAEDNLYRGVISIDSTFQGSILAPEATIDVHHNLDGNIIASDVNILSGETHRWDLQNKSDEETEPEEPGDTEEPTEPEEPGDIEDPTEPEEPAEPVEPEYPNPIDPTPDPEPEELPDTSEVPEPDLPEPEDVDLLPETEASSEGPNIEEIDKPEVTENQMSPQENITTTKENTEVSSEQVQAANNESEATSPKLDTRSVSDSEKKLPQLRSSSGWIASLLGLILVSIFGLFTYGRKKE